MFPLDFPLRVLRRNAVEGEMVLDPFCGRGTTTYAARILGLPSVGFDSSPIAVAIAQAKTVSVSSGQVIASVESILRSNDSPDKIPSSRFWKLAYHRETLRDICKLRESLLRRVATPAKTVLRAIILGALHGPLTKNTPSYLSNQSPRTFAPKPRYATRFWTDRGMKPQRVDVVEVVAARAKRYLTDQVGDQPGAIYNADSRKRTSFGDLRDVSWVITSPPYYGMRTYVPDQWIRHWFLGGPDQVEYAQREVDLEHGSPDNFADQLRLVWCNVASVANDRARLVCRYGGIQDRRNDPIEIFKASLTGSPWRITTIREAGTASVGKRQASQFGSRIKSQPRREFDIYAKLT